MASAHGVTWFFGHMVLLQSLTGYKPWFSCKIESRGSVSVFQGIFTSADKIFVSGGGLNARQ